MVFNGMPAWMSMIGSSHNITFEQWINKLENKPLSFLNNQLSPWVRGHNGKAFDDAIVHLIKKKRDEAKEEELPRKRPRISCIVQQAEEEDDEKYITRHVKNGPKGETVRVRVPRSLDAGD